MRFTSFHTTFHTTNFRHSILQNNGKLAHQVVPHVHCERQIVSTVIRWSDDPLVHVIPKPDEKQGLGVGWPVQDADKAELKQYCEEL